MYIQNKKLSELSSFGIGGFAKYFVEVESVTLLREVLSFCKSKELKFLVIGGGSNCLFDDHGFDGVVIKNNISFCDWEKNTCRVGGGYSFSLLSRESVRLGLTGLEFASGVPGTVGGAIIMNAGAHNMDVSGTLNSVEYIDISGELHVIPRENSSFGYRKSSFQNMRDIVIVSATFHLDYDDKAQARQKEMLSKRRETQPLGNSSGGCIFKNPEGYSAGQLVDSAGLKGYVVGGAKVSEKHANFIINTGNASSEDVLKLVGVVRNKVRDFHGINLDMEVILCPKS